MKCLLRATTRILISCDEFPRLAVESCTGGTRRAKESFVRDFARQRRKESLDAGYFRPSLSRKNVYSTRVGENMIEDWLCNATDISLEEKFLSAAKIHKSKLNCIQASARVNLELIIPCPNISFRR